jgi:hypothetical protein
VNSSHGRTRDEMKTFIEKAKNWHLRWWQLFLLQWPPRHLLRHLQRRKTLHLCRLLARILSCLLLPQSKMLRWRRLGLLVVFHFVLLNVKSCSRVQPENLSQRVLHLCKYISFL